MNSINISPGSLQPKPVIHIAYAWEHSYLAESVISVLIEL